MRSVAIGLVVVLGLATPVGPRAADEPGVAVSPSPSAPPTPLAENAPAVVAPNEAGDHIGQDVSIDGRVHAVHVSPLATVLAFAPNFAGFTATILTADRTRFPDDLPAQLRDRRVRVRGTITEYRGRAEMTLRDPSQITVLDPVAPRSPVAAPPPATPPNDELAAELRETLARIEARLDDLDARLTAIEDAAGL
jgi:hypothetical protein